MKSEPEWLKEMIDLYDADGWTPDAFEDLVPNLKARLRELETAQNPDMDAICEECGDRYGDHAKMQSVCMLRNDKGFIIGLRRTVFTPKQEPSKADPQDVGISQDGMSKVMGFEPQEPKPGQFGRAWNDDDPQNYMYGWCIGYTQKENHPRMTYHFKDYLNPQYATPYDHFCTLPTPTWNPPKPVMEPYIEDMEKLSEYLTGGGRLKPVWWKDVPGICWRWREVEK
jgi:hypothetical protein